VAVLGEVPAEVDPKEELAQVATLLPSFQGGQESKEQARLAPEGSSQG